MTLRLGVLVSGRGTNLQALLDACAWGESARPGETRLDARVVYVAANHAGGPALERAARVGVPSGTFVVRRGASDATATSDAAAWTPRTPVEAPASGVRVFADRAAAHAAMAEAIAAARADLVVLAGFDRVLDPAFFARLAGIPVINVHPSLLPAHGGRGMLGTRVHQAVLASGDRESGATVHRVEPDSVDGGEILVQRRVPVLPGDHVASLAARVLAEEHVALVEAVGLFEQRRGGRDRSGPEPRPVV